MSDKKVSKMAEGFYKYTWTGKILTGFLSLSGKDMKKSNCEEKVKQVKFWTEVVASREEKYTICACLKVLIWNVEG